MYMPAVPNWRKSAQIEKFRAKQYHKLADSDC